MNPTSFLQMLQGPFNFLRPDPEEVAPPDARPPAGAADAAPDLPGGRERHAPPGLPGPALPRAARAARRPARLHRGRGGRAGRRAAPRGARRQGPHAGLGALRRAALAAPSRTPPSPATAGSIRPSSGSSTRSTSRACFKEVPKRILRRDSEIGRRHGDAIKYRILDRFLDRVLSATYDLVPRLAGATEEVEEELFPRLLSHLRDNVLLFTEDYIGRDLGELSSYFAGSLRIDGRDLRRRLEELARWHFEQLATDAGLRAAVTHLLKADPRNAGRDLLARPGYVSYLATLRAYDPERLLPPAARPGLGEPDRQAQGVRADPRPAADDRADRDPRRRHGRARAAAGARRRRRRAAPLLRHPAARLHGALGGRPAGRALRHDLRHQRLLGDPVGAPPRRQRQPGRRLPGHVPLPAADQPAGHLAPRQAREVPGRRRLLLQPRGHQPAALLDPAPALLRRRPCARGCRSTAACGSPSTTAPTA